MQKESLQRTDKAESENLLKVEILRHLDTLPEARQVMQKLSIPTVDDFYADLISHPHVMRVVALSGGYSQEEANERLARNTGLIASFSRALSSGFRQAPPFFLMNPLHRICRERTSCLPPASAPMP